MNDQTTATPEGAPVEASLDDVIANIEAELDAGETPADAGQPAADEPETGDAETAPALEGEEATDAAEQPEGEAAPLPATVKVKVNGEDREVPLDEALKGYSRTEDYKAKTEQLAAERRTLQGQFAEQLNAVHERMLAFDPVLAAAQSTDWEALARDEPAEYVALKAAVEQRQQFMAAAQAEAARIEGEQLRETVERENNALMAAIPQLADPAKSSAYMGDLIGYLKRDMGFDDATIRSVTDHRLYVIADKARRFDAQEAARKAIPARKVTTVPTVKAVRPAGEAPRSTPNPKSLARMSDSQFAEYASRRLSE